MRDVRAYIASYAPGYHFALKKIQGPVRSDEEETRPKVRMRVFSAKLRQVFLPGLPEGQVFGLAFPQVLVK